MNHRLNVPSQQPQNPPALNSSNFNSLRPASLAPGDSNSRNRDVQFIGQKPPQRFIRAIVHRRRRKPDFQRPLDFARNSIVARARLHPHHETNEAIALADLDHAFARKPNSAVPTRICVAPSSTAISKSWLMPMDNSRSSGESPAMKRPRISSRSSRNRRK